jgi:hypothetical protein
MPTNLSFKLSLTVALTSLVTSVAMPSVASARVEAVNSAELRIAPPFVNRAALRTKLLENRRANVARFHAYRIAGVYPSNVFNNSHANICRDQQGHYCASATIIRMSGSTALVEKIAEDNNFFRIADVEQGPVMDWILTSGLTQAELVMIQKPFSPVTKLPAREPTETIAISPTMRKKETARLAKLYKEIEQKLAKNQRANLEVAVDRLMKNPELARQLLLSDPS